MQQTMTLRIQAWFLIFLVSTFSVHALPTDVQNLTYDQNGNMQQGLGNYIVYNEFNQVDKVYSGDSNGELLEAYTYDHEGNRLSKWEPQLDQMTYYVDDSFVEIVNSSGTFLTTYYYDGNTLVAREDDNGTTTTKFYYHPDHLGSTDLVTDQNGNVAEETTYKPYGAVIDGGAASDKLYTGKEQDSTGLLYYGARYYDPSIAIFTQPDSTIADIYNPQDLNRYNYVRNNPYKYVDPSGESPVLAILRGAIAAARPAFTATVNFVKTYGPRALAYFGLGAATNIGEQLVETGDITQVDPQQVVIAGTTSAVTGTTTNALVSTQGTLTLSKGGKEIGNVLISQYSGEVAGNIARNKFEGRPALENSGNVDPNTFIRNVVVSTALGTALPSSGGFNEQSSILPNQYSSQTSLNRAQFSTANNQHSNQNRASSTRQSAWKSFSNRLQSRRNRR